MFPSFQKTQEIARREMPISVCLAAPLFQMGEPLARIGGSRYSPVPDAVAALARL